MRLNCTKVNKILTYNKYTDTIQEFKYTCSIIGKYGGTLEDVKNRIELIN